MCAIFGWFGSDDDEKLHRMADTMRHRGPDGDGYLNTDSAAIGMTRLLVSTLCSTYPFTNSRTHTKSRALSVFSIGNHHRCAN